MVMTSTYTGTLTETFKYIDHVPSGVRCCEDGGYFEKLHHTLSEKAIVAESHLNVPQ